MIFKPILLYSESLNNPVSNKKPKLRPRFEKIRKAQIDKQKLDDQAEKEIREIEKIQSEEAQRIERIKKEMALKESLLEFENKLKMFDYVLTLYTK